MLTGFTHPHPQPPVKQTALLVCMSVRNRLPNNIASAIRLRRQRPPPMSPPCSSDGASFCARLAARNKHRVATAALPSVSAFAAAVTNRSLPVSASPAMRPNSRATARRMRRPVPKANDDLTKRNTNHGSVLPGTTRLARSSFGILKAASRWRTNGTS